MITLAEIARQLPYPRSSEPLSAVLERTADLVDLPPAPRCRVCGREGSTFDGLCRMDAPDMVNARRSTRPR
jgi:hypothetical protein